MLTPAFVDVQPFFYPIGNTPAISLTQSIPFGDPADILLLGCGDVRNILFTIHNDRSRALDITCCDSQKAVIARNILILTLIIDDDNGQDVKALWDIYYLLYLEESSAELLRSHSKTLCELSSSMETWNKCRYGRFLSFCDTATLADVRRMWAFYSIERKGSELARFRESLISLLHKAKDRASTHVSPAQPVTNLTSHRAAFTSTAGNRQDLDALLQRYWKHGSTDVRKNDTSAYTYPNPAFFTIGDGALLDHCSSPSQGFHLAGVDVPLDSTDEAVNQLPRRERYTALARAEFAAWTASFRKRCQESYLRIRFFAGDAIAFAHTLQHMAVTSERTAHWYRHRTGVSPLVLDGVDYGPGKNTPTSFDVIDTSSLLDHLGPLTLLSATSPLLRDRASAVIYTEILTNRHTSKLVLLDHLLCANTPTISTLLGLFPIEYWTNTSATMNEDLDSKVQLCRTSWKRSLCMSSVAQREPPSIPLRFEPTQLALILYRVYLQMFLSEYAFNLSSSVEVEGNLHVFSIVWYQRSSFASFLRLVQTRVTCDWNAVMEQTVDHVLKRPDAPVGLNYFQELNVYLLMLGVFTTAEMKEWHNRHGRPKPAMFSSRLLRVDEKHGDLRDWKDMPPVVCVTIQVPRQKLSVFTDMKINQLGTPVLHGFARSAELTGANRWQNIFPACQLTFGRLSTTGTPHDDSYKIHVDEDDDATWDGQSPLIVSFFSSASLLVQKDSDVIVGLGVHSTPTSAKLFLPKLGPLLEVYNVPLGNSNEVHVTRFPPNQNGTPIVPGFANTTPRWHGSATGSRLSLIAHTEGSLPRIKSLTGRLDMASNELRRALSRGVDVRKFNKSPCEITVTLGENATMSVPFPVFIKEEGQKLILARKSSYVEVVGQVASCFDWMTFPHAMYPIHQLSGKLTSCLMPYLDLQKCPMIQTTQHDKLDGLATHMESNFSLKERAMMFGRYPAQSEVERARQQLKFVISHMFNLICKTEKPSESLVGSFTSERDTTVRNIIFARALRWNPADRSVVLDCAVLPMHRALRTILGPSLSEMEQKVAFTVEMDDIHWGLWRHALPAYVERCREWDHRASCEYTVTGAIPLSTKNEEPVLCTCGNGKFPDGYIRELPGWGLFSKHAVRAAISPVFWAPFAGT